MHSVSKQVTAFDVFYLHYCLYNSQHYNYIIMIYIMYKTLPAKIMFQTIKPNEPWPVGIPKLNMPICVIYKSIGRGVFNVHPPVT